MLTETMPIQENAGLPTLPRKGSLIVYNTNIGAWEDQVDAAGMRVVLRSLLGRLRRRGHTVRQDPEIETNHPAIARDYWVGRIGDLESTIQLQGRSLAIEFFQNVANVDNRYGGRYDSNKLQRMPQSIRIRCIVEMTAVLRKLRELGYTFGRPVFVEPLSLLAVRDVAAGTSARARLGTIEDFNDRWDMFGDRARGVHRFERDETGWPTAKEIGHHLDRDGVVIRNGDLRYTRVDGRLVCGIVRPNMNGMWILGGSTQASSREIFLCEDPASEPRRLVPKQPDRLRSEIEKALKAGDYRRVEALARVLQRPASALIASRS